MTGERCEQTRQLAPELALGVVDGEERARALEHLATCHECRRAVDRLAEVADGLLLLAPDREVPVGFDSAVLERMRPEPARKRRRAWLIPAAAAATALALALGAAGALLAVDDDLDIASRYRHTLAEANGEYFRAASLDAPGGARAGTVFAYQGEPSWLFVVVAPEYRAGVRGAEIVNVDGGRIPLRPFQLDPATGSWGRALPVELREVAVVRLRRAGGETLVAKLKD